MEFTHFTPKLPSHATMDITWQDPLPALVRARTLGIMTSQVVLKVIKEMNGPKILFH